MSELMEILSPVLGDKLAKAIIDHRIAKKAKLTPYAAELQVREYLKTGNPVAAAEMQLLHGWQAIKATWYFKEIEKDRRSPARNSSDMADFTSDFMSRYNERTLQTTNH
jgi:hypothetical protein